MCYLQEVRCCGHGSRMLGVVGRRYNLQWSGKGDVVLKKVFHDELNG